MHVLALAVHVLALAVHVLALAVHVLALAVHVAPSLPAARAHTGIHAIYTHAMPGTDVNCFSNSYKTMVVGGPRLSLPFAVA